MKQRLHTLLKKENFTQNDEITLSYQLNVTSGGIIISGDSNAMAGDYIHIFGPEAVTLEGSGGGEIGNDPPIAIINAKDKVYVNKSIQFNGSDSYDPDNPSAHNKGIANYIWDFGDGENSTDPISTHNYSAEGTYMVTLTVTDDDGASDTDMVTVAVFSMDILPASPTRIWVKGQGIHTALITVNATSNGGHVDGGTD